MASIHLSIKDKDFLEALQTLADEFENLEDSVDDSNTEIERLQKIVDEMETDNDQLREKVKELEEALAEAYLTSEISDK